MELGSPESIKSAVAAGLGVSILSVATLEKEQKLNLLAQRSLDPPISRPFLIIYQRQKFRVKAIEEFLRFNQSNGRWQQGQPGNSDELLRRLGQPVRDAELIVELLSETPGLAVEGRELPAPPPSVQRLLTETHAAGHVQTLSVRVRSRQHLATGYVLRGEHLLTVKSESKGNR